MKKLLFITVIIISFFSCKDDHNGFQIDVTINDMPDGSKVILKKIVDKTILHLDTTTIKNGKFSFRGTIKEPMMLGMFIKSSKQGLIPFVDVTDHLTITAYKDSLQKSIIKGSKLQNLLTKVRSTRTKLQADSKKLFPEYLSAKKENDTIKMDSLNKIMMELSERTSKNEWDFVKNNPNSFVAALVFKDVMRHPAYTDSLKIVYDNFSDAIKNSDIAIPLKNKFRMFGISLSEEKPALSTGN